MGRREREVFKAELEKLSKYTEETPAELEQNRRTAEAEKNVTFVENLWVRAQVD